MLVVKNKSEDHSLFNRAILLSLTLLLTVPASAQTLDPNAVANALSRAFETATEAITPSLVSITAKQEAPKKNNKPDEAESKKPPETPVNPQGDNSEEKVESKKSDNQHPQVPKREFGTGTGTGVVIDHRGYVLTNNHVIQHAKKVTVTFFNRKKYRAKIVGKDVKADLALLKITGDFEPAAIGDSDELHIGQWVIAAGSPFGLANSYTAGIISAKGRSMIMGMPDADFIQTDAAVNMGNSGGPLINVDGEVIGINTAIYSRSGGNLGIGFAIPINRAMSVVQPMIKD